MARVSSPRKLVAIVLAGGRGTRLFGPQGGPKWLFTLNGRPLIDYSLSAIRVARVDEIAIVVRDDDFVLRSKYPDFAQIADEGNGTFSAVLAAAEYAVDRQANAVITSCDLVCAPMAAKALVESASRNPDWLASFGVTTIANDQSPIWVHSNASGRIVNYGKQIESSEYAFASIRFATLAFLQMALTSAKAVPDHVDTDTKLMRHLIVNEGVIAGSVNIGDALDVDDEADAKVAEKISRSFRHT